MFKKAVLVGLLLTVILVLSGCATYDASFTGDANYKSYGGVRVPKVGGSGGECANTTEYKTIGNLCFAIGSFAKCQELNAQSQGKWNWHSAEVLRYSIGAGSDERGLCFPSCSTNQDCGGIGVCSGNLCSPTCTTDSDCLPGLTSCKTVNAQKICVYNTTYLNQAPQFQGSFQVSQQAQPQIQPSQELPAEPTAPGDVGLATDLSVELELRPALTPTAYGPHGLGGFNGGVQFWIDVYLVSASKTTLSDTTIKLTSRGVNFVAAGANGILSPSVTFSQTTATTGVLAYDAASSQNVMPKSRIYFGSLKASKSSPGPLTFSLDPSSFAWYDNKGFLYTLKLGSIKTVAQGSCIYNPGLLCQGKCGKLDNGCGGVVDCTLYDPAQNACASGQVCVNNACVPALGLAFPNLADQQLCQDAATLPRSEDKTLLQGVSNAIKNNQESEIDAILDIFTALNVWFAALQS